MVEDSNRARDHLANERTFLAWVRTSVAIVVFGFAIGRFAIAMRQLTAFQGVRFEDYRAFRVDGNEFDSGGSGDGGRRTGAIPEGASAIGSGKV